MKNWTEFSHTLGCKVSQGGAVEVLRQAVLCSCTVPIVNKRHTDTLIVVDIKKKARRGA
jgi:hypothetical protein